MVKTTKMPVVEGASSPAPSSDDTLLDDMLKEAVLANLENLQETLAEAPPLQGCEDGPSVIGSHGLPLLNFSPAGALAVSPDAPSPRAPPRPPTSPDAPSPRAPPRPPTSPDAPSPRAPPRPPTSPDAPSPWASPRPPTSPRAPLRPPTRPLNTRVLDSDDESPCMELDTPLKFDTSEFTWIRSEKEPGGRCPRTSPIGDHLQEPRGQSPRASPTRDHLQEPRGRCPRTSPIRDYLQVPPRPRLLRRKRPKLSFLDSGAAPAGVPPTAPQVTPESSGDAASGDVTQVSGVRPQADSLSAANCVIKLPRKHRKPSFSHINIPCYHRRPSGQALDVNFDYTFTLMYGRYTKDLSRYARQEAKKLKTEEKSTLESGTSGLRPYRGKVASKCVRFLSTVWRATFARVGEDWVFLAMLGVVMAIISFIMDYGIAMCNKARLWLYRDLASHTALQYLAWVSLPVCLILFSAGFSHLLAPQAVGSGIPEMKTILRGVVLKEYLTFKTLIAKVIGLTATLGTGLPLGKEGPFVHIASLVATLLSKAVTSFKGIYENESRNSEMLAAACAVGVACCFAAPVGGVLFSIEVTSVYFAVRNYWRGFFAAVCGAMMFRLLAVWFNDEETLTALFKTNFKVGYPFDPQELFVFALVGVLCGFLGALFVYSHRRYVIFMRKNKKMKAFLQKSRLLYPFFITMIYGSLSFPLGLGQFFGTELGGHQQVIELFSNITWTKEVHTVQEFTIVENWRTPWTGIFVSLIIYSAFTFFGCVICSTLPVPSGLFIPVFKTGAAVGRIVGEIMASTFPNGLRYGGHNHIIIPGGYSIVGAAALAGAVTHTISTSVIVFELTGQITHILPVMIAVLIANGIAQLLQPSIYDSIIQIKKLPYLPDILTATSGAYNIYVEDFMVRDVKYIWYGIAYRELKNILKEHKKIRSLPLVDSPDSMILLGSIQRSELISMLEEHLGKDRRLRVINKWKFAAQKVLEAEQLHEMGENQHENERKRAKQRLLDIEEAIKRKPTTVPSGSLTLMAGMGADENDSLLVPSTVPTVPAPPAMTPAPPSMTPAPPSVTPAPASVTPAPPSVIPAPSMIPAPPSIIPSSNIPAAPSIFLEVPSTSASAISSTATTISTPNTVAPLPVIMTDMMEVLGKQERRPSRFEVTKIETPSKENESSIALQIDAMEIPAASEPTLDRDNTFRRNTMPKSILKKTNSFILHPTASSPIASPQHTPYATVHAGDSKLRQAFESVIRKTNLRNGSDKEAHSTQSVNSNNPKRVSLPMERMVEMTLEEQRRWEEEELDKEVDFSKCHIDPAPFQLVERTSLLKVHSLFSMLGLNHAYVTAIGRIIGVVALKELRQAVESTNSGDFSKPRRDKGVGGSFRERFLRSTIRRKLRKAIEETNSGDFPKADPAPAATSTRATDASSSTEATKEGSKE
ncbi:chloride channel protein 2 isoform X3 [Procambarus clarkii]|uniref:chloride channel protein 2 isoform X3 n=1 Tax=Procambarus clarkii TaxID=6728 RepID=UPI003742B3EE